MSFQNNPFNKKVHITQSLNGAGKKDGTPSQLAIDATQVSCQQEWTTDDESEDIMEETIFHEPFNFSIGNRNFRFTYNEKICPFEIAFRERQSSRDILEGIDANSDICKYIRSILDPISMKGCHYYVPSQIFADYFDNMQQLDTFRMEYSDPEKISKIYAHNELEKFVKDWKCRYFSSFTVPEDTINVMYPRLISIVREGRKRALRKKEAADELLRLSYQKQLELIKTEYEAKIAGYLAILPLISRNKGFAHQEDEVKETYLKLYTDTVGDVAFAEWAEEKWKSEKYKAIREKFISLLENEDFKDAIVANFKKPPRSNPLRSI